MICKRCNNQMVWVGSMHGGGLTCEHCANNDDLLTEALYRDAQENLSPYMVDTMVDGRRVPKKLETVHINVGSGDYPEGTKLFDDITPMNLEESLAEEAKRDRFRAKSDDDRYLEPDYDI